jgi:pyridoxamine 5'-phosphate oxidase
MTVRDLLRNLPVFDRPLPGFDTEQVPDDPASLFVRWLGEAIDAKVIEPHVMTLSTADAQGRPDARALILKDVDDGGWQFATSAASTKGTQLKEKRNASGPRAASPASAG